MLRRRISWVAILSILALVLAACGGDTAATSTTAAPETTTTAAPTTTAGDGGETTTTTEPELVPESDTLRLIIDTLPDFANANRYVWVEMLEERFGALGVEVEVSILEGSDSALRAVVANQADFNIGSLGAAVRLIAAADEGVKVIASDGERTTYVLLAREGIESLDDLVGGTIGIRLPGDAGDVVTRAALDAAGFDLSQVQFVEVGGTSARIAALVSGQIDLGAAHIAEATAAIAASPGLTPLMFAADVMPPWIQSGLVARDDWLETHPVMAQMVVDALVDTNRWITDNPEEFAEYTKIALPEEDMDDATRLEAIMELIRIGFYPVNGGISPEVVESFIEVEVSTGGLEADNVPPAEQWVDRTFLDDYLARNGTR
ncbi:MAG TPA: ABC transporter substrate-binding protein [Acidimicrobiia bacterium]|nr:ABC transporter substrate-binding protein [Acidimicrobiia bacterium]